MNKILSYNLLLAFGLIISILSCQNEPIQTVDAAPDNVLATDAPLVGMIRSATSNNGGDDNSLDGSDCFSISFPVTILVAGSPMVIEDIDALMSLSDFLDSMPEDSVELVYPITIVFSDYTEVVVDSEEQLEAYMDACFDGDYSDDDYSYSCVNFVYPLSLSTFDANGEFVDTFEVASESDLYDLFDEYYMSDDFLYYVALNYPVTLVDMDGYTTTVFSDEELEAVFMNSECYDYSGDDSGDDDWGYSDCSAEELSSNLTEDCLFFIADGTTGFGMFLSFNADGSASVFADNTNSAALASTTYSVDTSADGYVTLTINELSGDLITISGEWIVTYCDLDILALFNNANGAAMLLVDDCE